MISLSTVILVCAIGGAGILVVRAVATVKHGSEGMLETYEKMLEKARATAQEEVTRQAETKKK